MADDPTTPFPELPSAPDAIVAHLLTCARRLLLFGAPGSGKSTLTHALGRALADRGQPVHCLTADPGSPAFGPPGAVSLGIWQHDTWHPLASEALCTLDAARFRLPLAAAVSRLTARIRTGILLIDSPGAIRGIAGAELLPALAEAGAVDAIIALIRGNEPPPLADELSALGIATYVVRSPRRPIAPARAPVPGVGPRCGMPISTAPGAILSRCARCVCSEPRPPPTYPLPGADASVRCSREAEPSR